MQASNRLRSILGHMESQSVPTANKKMLPNSTNGFTTAQDRVTIDLKDGIAMVTLNRADKKNALDGDMLKGIAAAGKWLKANGAVRVVVLTGAGSDFCAGLDLSVLKGIGGKSDALSLYDGRGVTHLAQQTVWVWQELEVPVIAAIKGFALGGGLQIALGCDFRFVHADTKMSMREVHWGIIPDMCGTYLLSRLVRDDFAKELTMTARVFSGKEAHGMGLVTKLCADPLADAVALATTLANKSPHAIRASKRLLNKRLEFREQFAEERREIMLLIGSPNQTESVMAGMQRRKPVFKDV